MGRIRGHGRAVRALATLALATALTAPAGAQVNTESMRVGTADPGWGGTFDLNSSLQRGNTEREVLGGGVRLQYAWPPPADAEDDDARGR